MPALVARRQSHISTSFGLVSINALALTGLANFRVVGQVAGSTETKGRAGGGEKLHPALLAHLQDTMIFEVAMPNCFASFTDSHVNLDLQYNLKL